MKRNLLLLLLLSTFMISAQEDQHYQAKQYQSQGETLPYRILYPDGFDPDQQYPLIVFLHGAGERGTDNQKQLMHGGEFFKEKVLSGEYPAIVVFPQAPQEEYWARIVPGSRDSGFGFLKDPEPTWPMALVIELVDELLEEDHIKKDQVYVGGLSMGGMGTLELLAHRPKTFAAAIVICGGGNPESVSAYSDHTALWFFHGAKDEVVPVEHSYRMVHALQDLGADVTLTIYEEAGHNAWDPAFAEGDLLSWLFSKKLGDQQ